MANNATNKLSSFAKTGRKLAGWTIIIAICIGGIVAIRITLSNGDKSTKTATEKPWGRVLYCGEQTTRLAPLTKINLLLIPADCETGWQVLPVEARRFKRVSLLEGNPVKIQAIYRNNSRGNWETLDMTSYIILPRWNEITGFRFRNSGSDTSKAVVYME